ncbi:MAG: hypothetical protein QXH93_00670 [Conexivisphaerales archaeon]
MTNNVELSHTQHEGNGLAASEKGENMKALRYINYDVQVKG